MDKGKFLPLALSLTLGLAALPVLPHRPALPLLPLMVLQLVLQALPVLPALSVLPALALLLLRLPPVSRLAKPRLLLMHQLHPRPPCASANPLQTWLRS